jgi:hypothetical protein
VIGKIYGDIKDGWKNKTAIVTAFKKNNKQHILIFYERNDGKLRILKNGYVKKISLQSSLGEY